MSDRKLTETGIDALNVYGDAWKHAETEHFVYHYRDKKDAETILVHAETYYAWVKQQLGVKADPSVRKSHIFIFGDKAVWKNFMKRTPEKLPGAEAFTNGIELFLYKDPFWLEAPRVLAHEITHLVVARFIEGPMPLFLNEGLSEFIGTRAIAMKADGDPYRVRVFKSIPEKDLIPMEKLLSMKDYPENTETFYLESELFIRFLVNQGESKLYDLLKRVAQGEDFDVVVEDLYKISPETLSKKFSVYAATRSDKISP